MDKKKTQIIIYHFYFFFAIEFRHTVNQRKTINVIKYIYIYYIYIYIYIYIKE